MADPTEEEVMAALIREEPEYAKKIPAITLHGIQQYVAAGTPGGHFLQALLTNDLAGVHSMADDENWAALRDILYYLNNCIPMECYGDNEAYEAWIALKRQARLKREAELKEEGT